MTNYYLDIETYGRKEEDPYDFEIVTIQYQKLWGETGKPIDDLIILKSWESSEKQIIEEFFSFFQIDNDFNFVPIGFNLRYEFIVLSKRAKHHGMDISLEDLLKGPFIDIRSILVILNKGLFKGSGLDKFTGKKSTGRVILDFYENKDYKLIEEYIREEITEFLNLYQQIVKVFPECHEMLKQV